MFRQGVNIILRFSTAVFIYSFSPKYSLCWPQSDCYFYPLLRLLLLSLSQLCVLGDLPLRAEESLHGQQEFFVSGLTHLGHLSDLLL